MNSVRWLLVASAWLAPAAAMAGDWAYWRGPETNGISREKNLVSDWSLETGKNVLWTSDIGGRATPCVLNGRVYLNCRTPEDVSEQSDEKIDAQQRVVCWDAKTGDLLWEDRFNVFLTDIPQPRVGWASMTGDTESGNVYLHSVDGLLRCYTPEGEVVWEHSMFEEYGKISGYGGRTQTPIIDEDRIIVGYLATNWGDTKGPAPKHSFYAFDKNTGDLLWVSAPGGAPQDTIYTNPTIAVINGQRMLICGNADGGCYAINARTGQPIWGFRMSLRGLNSSPVVDGNYVYISHGEDNIDTSELGLGRIQCIDATGTGDVTETHSVWRVDGVKSGYAGMLVKDGILYVVEDIGNLIAFDSKTGDTLWSYNIGTVGKGSPVWADGKLYVMEVNGRIHILKPSREKCEELSMVELKATTSEGMDEIYASPAIADGRIYFVTRDRTICVGDESVEAASDPIPALPEEAPVGTEVALLQLRPYEVEVQAGDSAEFKLLAYDANGRLIEETSPTLEVDAALAGTTADGSVISTEAGGKERAGKVTAKVGDLTASARVRVFPALPWQWDFEGYGDNQVPATWIRAFKKVNADTLDDTRVMRASPGKGKPGHFVMFGPSTMSGYTIQADVQMAEQRRRLPSLGLVNQRYCFILKGNTSKISLQTWQAHLRLDAEEKFRLDPDVWYTMKLKVSEVDGGALVQGKVWKRGDDEPEAWSIEVVDPHANTQGSPGIYVYNLANSYFDNIVVSKD